MPEPTDIRSPLRRRFRFAPLFLLAGLAVATASGPAAATAINMDEFNVTRSGSPLFDDTFNQNITLSGGAGAVVSSGVSYTGGGTANYFVRGAIPETTANNGQALLNTANGILETQPAPFFPLISHVSAFLQTGTATTAIHALTPTTAFTVTGLFDLSLPGVVGGTDALTLSNRYSVNSGIGNFLQIRLRDCAPGSGACGALSGPVLQFFWGSFISNTSKLISEVGLSAADLTDPQFEFKLTKAAGSDVIDADYAFGSGNTLASFTGTLTSLGSTDSSTDVFTASLQTVQPGFEAFEPVSVPEPPSLLLLGGALGLFLFGRQARRRRQPLTGSRRTAT